MKFNLFNSIQCIQQKTLKYTVYLSLFYIDWNDKKKTILKIAVLTNLCGFKTIRNRHFLKKI